MNKRVAQTKFPKALIPKKKRVAAYARVSSGKDAMLHSLSEQIRYYSMMIQNRPGLGVCRCVCRRSHNGHQRKPSGVTTDVGRLPGRADRPDPHQIH